MVEGDWAFLHCRRQIGHGSAAPASGSASQRMLPKLCPCRSSIRSQRRASPPGCKTCGRIDDAAGVDRIVNTLEFAAHPHASNFAGEITKVWRKGKDGSGEKREEVYNLRPGGAAVIQIGATLARLGMSHG